MAAKLKATAIDPPWTLRLANTIKLIYSEAMSMLNKKQQNAKRDNLPNPISWRIAQIEAVFANACRNAMLDKPVHITSQSLKGADLELSGVAAEGAAMGLAMLDRLTPWTKDRWQQFLYLTGKQHIYTVHIGLGMALAKLNANMPKELQAIDPFFRSVVLDGYGFYLGYFARQNHIIKREIPGFLNEHQRRAFDQGLGRSLWFLHGGRVKTIKNTIDTFESSRQADLWSGVGVACAYAGGVHVTTLKHLQKLAGNHDLELQLGVAYAAKVRAQAGNMASHTELACRILGGHPANSLAQLADSVLGELDKGARELAYLLWRQTVKERLVEITLSQ
jgi:hypothetical protein